jgi:hypothetical protein
VQKVVADHKGSVDVASHPGETTFTLVLPQERAQESLSVRPPPLASDVRPPPLAADARPQPIAANTAQGSRVSGPAE